MNPPWHHKVSHPAQLGGIETSVLDNGPGRGVRIAWINTGSGLRYKVVLDRGMDIVDAFHNAHSLAFLSHGGITAPRPDSDRNLEWLRTFAGGLLTTCGLHHVGPPEGNGPDHRGLHGRVANLPAEIESVIQPDLHAGRLDFSITGVMRESSVLSPQLELRRTISGTLGKAEIHVDDLVTNRTNLPVDHMMLYHCNFGYPLADEGALLEYEGETVSRSVAPGDDGFLESDHPPRIIPPPLEEHRGFGEAVAFIQPRPAEDGHCRAGVVNRRLGLAVHLRYRQRELPWLTNWQHWGPGEYVTGLEPGNVPPIGRDAARARGILPSLAAGESVRYQLSFLVTESERT